MELHPMAEDFLRRLSTEDEIGGELCAELESEGDVASGSA